MKKFLIVFFILLFLWPLYKGYMPNFFKSSGLSNNISAIIYSWENFFFDQYKELDKPKYWSRIIDIDSDLLVNTFEKTKNNSSKMVLYIFEPECFTCRHILFDINDLAAENKDTKFMVVSVGKNKKHLSTLLNNFETVSFRPLMASEKNFIKFKAYLAKNSIAVKEFPAIFYVDGKEGEVKSLSPTIFIKNKLNKYL